MIVDENGLFFFGKLNFIDKIELKQALDGFKKHSEVRIGIAAPNGRSIFVNLKRRLLIKEIINKMLQELFLDHIGCCNAGLGGELIPELKVLIEFSPTLRNSCGDKAEEVVEVVND